jgi:hypothetical protein
MPPSEPPGSSAHEKVEQGKAAQPIRGPRLSLGWGWWAQLRCSQSPTGVGYPEHSRLIARIYAAILFQRRTSLPQSNPLSQRPLLASALI